MNLIGFNSFISWAMTNLQRLIKLVEANRIHEALNAIASLEVPDKVKGFSNYGGELLRVMIKCNVDFDIVMNVCSQWRQKGINKFALSHATEAALDHLPYSQAKNYLSQLVKNQSLARPHLYAPLIVKTSSLVKICSLVKDELKLLAPRHPEGTFELFADIVWSKFDQDQFDEFFARCLLIGLTPYFLINTCIANCLNTGNVIRIGQLISSSDFSFRADYKLVPYLASFILYRNFDKSVPIMESLGSRSLNQSVFNSFFLLNASGLLSGSEDHIERIQSICSAMRKKAFYITPIAGELLLSAYDGLPSISSSINRLINRRARFPDELHSWYFYSSSSCSQIEAFETHLKVLERSKSNKIRGIVRKLILAYCNANNQPIIGPNPLVYQRINQLMGQLKKNDVNITPAMASVLMSFYAINDDLEKALYYKSLIPAHFTIDFSKILRLGIRMASNGRLKDSIDMILEQIHKPKNERPNNQESKTSYPSHGINSLVRDYLELIAINTKDFKLVKDLSNSLFDLGHIKPCNKSLRPRITVHLCCDDVEGALNELNYCIRMFKKTPGQNILIQYLVDKKLFDRIGPLIDLVSRYFDNSDIIHNCVNRLVISGYPEMGRELLFKFNFSAELEEKSSRTVIVDNLARENVAACLSLVQFYRKKFTFKERKHFYNRIYSLSLISGDSSSVDTILRLMKEENIEPNGDDDEINNNIVRKNGEKENS